MPEKVLDKFSDKKVIGLIAGHGQYPKIIKERLNHRGIKTVTAVLKGQGMLSAYGEDAKEFYVGRAGEIAGYFIKNGVSEIIMAGGVNRKSLMRYLKPDLAGLVLAVKGFKKGDDSFLRMTADYFLSRGITVVDPEFLVSDLFASKGVLAAGDNQDTEFHVLEDLQKAFKYAKKTGVKDKGQSVLFYHDDKITHGEKIISEDSSGTDALILKAPVIGAVVVKVAKPGQDRRFDMPVIGPSTIVTGAAKGIKAIGVEAGSVMILDKQEVYELCKYHNIILFGI